MDKQSKTPSLDPPIHFVNRPSTPELPSVDLSKVTIRSRDTTSMPRRHRDSSQSSISTLMDSIETSPPPTKAHPSPIAHSLSIRIASLNALLLSLILLSVLCTVFILAASIFLSFAVRVGMGIVRSVVHWNPYVLGSSGHLLGELLGEFTYAFWAGWAVWMD
ncbi:hypothetical protein BU23DRAFT_551329 [Bimuria novae-zelandiae CBS 107.79]|uniref:Uncharacterized protein n=1 Tax=Bimuria novae-zelandiae CBS 107.79 TaxID=1447943 RepID=A0A6A5VH38_9PLEO|nr:hypothetical protein BU23DRAFT_551329 [Bimuria novae-zelandiae CBS 107.79]